MLQPVSAEECGEAKYGLLRTGQFGDIRSMATSSSSQRTINDSASPFLVAERRQSIIFEEKSKATVVVEEQTVIEYLII